ncbi:DUF29 family protein [Limnofasciculus baicalensis]|uniref:DUF29 domain-containing protein n=1 Tax=Limnofasciculus baicalensis BBK-W-15 TaxID=2699891 RepID=A0AAE3H0C4_9CYAN|nr:DUF29 family protein [Limnofasciculus baicalensis]MCP2731932.1 DUF29 domain-containing protein [Limnofasciculus baicalensis BBK-W-15]
MTQELIDLRASILEGRYGDALAIVDELEGMSKQAVLRNIESFIDRILIHLIKNQIEQRLTNSWAASIRDSVREIYKLNLKENKKSYYINSDEWEEVIEDEIEAAIATASVEVADGAYTPCQLLEMVDRSQIIENTQSLLALTYIHSKKELPLAINDYLSQLAGGDAWQEGR